MREEFGSSPELSLGEIPTFEARPLIESLKAQGFEVAAQSRSFVSYLPIDQTTGCAWLIEEDAEVARVVEEMLAAGVSVQDVMVD